MGEVNTDRSARFAIAAGSVILAAYSVLTDAFGSGPEPWLHLTAVGAILAWAVWRFPPAAMAVVAAASVAGLGWAGGTPDGVVFQAVIAAGVVGYAVLSLPQSLILAALVATSPAVGVLLPGNTDWGPSNWFIGAWLLWLAGRLSGRLEATITELKHTRRELVDAELRAGRREVARDVHDIVGHCLTAVLLHVEGARQALGPDDVGAKESLEKATEAGRLGMKEIRTSLESLRADGESDRLALPDGSALHELLNRSTGAVVTIRGPIGELQGSVASTAYRVVQEAMTNASKHGSGAPAHVSVIVDDHVEICVRNELSPNRSNDGGRQLGIIGMRERARQIGGTLTAERVDGDFVVKATLPWP